MNQTFTQIQLAELPDSVNARKKDGWAFVQILAVNTEQGIDLIYSFRKDGVVDNMKIAAVAKTDIVPSITDKYLAAFVFENEIHDLFGVTITDIAIDFAGNFYALSQAEPMTIISPEKKAALDKAAKIAAAKAAKATKESTPSDTSDNAELEAKLADLDPEKAAKVRAAMEAKAKREAEKVAQEKGEDQ